MASESTARVSKTSPKANKRIDVEGLENFFTQDHRDLLAKGLSLKEAVYYYGDSRKIIKERIQRGEIPAIKLPESEGAKWRVFPDGVPKALKHLIPSIEDFAVLESEETATPKAARTARKTETTTTTTVPKTSKLAKPKTTKTKTLKTSTAEKSEAEIIVASPAELPILAQESEQIVQLTEQVIPETAVEMISPESELRAEDRPSYAQSYDPYPYALQLNEPYKTGEELRQSASHELIIEPLKGFAKPKATEASMWENRQLGEILSAVVNQFVEQSLAASQVVEAISQEPQVQLRSGRDVRAPGDSNGEVETGKQIEQPGESPAEQLVEQLTEPAAELLTEQVVDPPTEPVVEPPTEQVVEQHVPHVVEQKDEQPLIWVSEDIAFPVIPKIRPVTRSERNETAGSGSKEAREFSRYTGFANDFPQEEIANSSSISSSSISTSSISSSSGDIDQTIANLEKALKETTYRNNYLEARLSGLEDELKYFTQNQHQVRQWNKYAIFAPALIVLIALIASRLLG